jgi:hypothetical protein
MQLRGERVRQNWSLLACDDPSRSCASRCPIWKTYWDADGTGKVVVLVRLGTSGVDDKAIGIEFLDLHLVRMHQ